MEEKAAIGRLVARRYRTTLLAKAADHTYVECGVGGKGWACWGGKTGGSLLISGNGSTERANLIAEPDERAGIGCYLINGVCHQAANRILLPVPTIVSGARGYAVSSALFGTYGRPSGAFGACLAPFSRHSDVVTDLPECVSAPSKGGPIATAKASNGGTAKLRSFIQGVLKLYEQAETLFVTERPDVGAIEEFAVELFMHDVAFRLGQSVRPATIGRLKDVRRVVERARVLSEQRYAAKHVTWSRFVEEFNQTTIAFQSAIAGVLSDRNYHRLLDLPRGNFIVLADPEIIEFAAPRR